MNPTAVLPPDGWIVEPGSPEESLLIDRVSADDPQYRMPPVDQGDRLSEREIKLLRKWVKQGAKWQRHWAFVPPVEPELPTTSDPAWCRPPVDRFVLARLDAAGISPSPDTKPGRWLIRTSLELVGLPPQPEEVSEFVQAVQAEGETAYEAAVDQLLASPHFGERWATVWLDQVRYADSSGLGVDSRRSNWKYRDWVIDALNRDVPFDQFTIKQLAGDLLPAPTMEDLVATACHRLTQTNNEGGTDDEEFRVEAVLDRVNTTWQVWQGVTFGCARCHDHPYDPFRQEEYYKFVAFFNNTQDSDLVEEYPLISVPINAEDYERARKLDEEIAALTDAVWNMEHNLVQREEAWLPIANFRAGTSNTTKVVVEPRDGRVEFHTVGTVSANTDYSFECELPEELDVLTAIRVTLLPLDPKSALKDSEWGFVLSSVEASFSCGAESQPIKLVHVIPDEPLPLLNPQESLRTETTQGFAAYPRIHYPRTGVFVLESPCEVPTGAKLSLVLRQRVSESFHPLVARRGHFAVSQEAAFTELHTDEECIKKNHRLIELADKRHQIQSTPLPVMAQRPAHLQRPTHVFVRGAYLSKQQEVSPGVPDSFPPLPAGVAPDRLTMAQWLVNEENPLTARVTVNRFWARLFGTGIVATEEDFGSSGEPPSHPELLDFLAVRFQKKYNWSVKQLLRVLVLSSTYRQCSSKRPELMQIDPHNRLLAVGPRQRLSGELIRDRALVISGLLEEKMFGPPVQPPIPEGVWRPFASDTWNTPKPGEENRYRRSIYTYTKRSIPYPLFAAFDAPTREYCAPRRLQSNTSLQSLMTLNDASFSEFSEALAVRMQASSSVVREQLHRGFALATSRKPRDSELDRLEAFYHQFPESRSPVDRLTMAASVLINLDEVQNK